MKASKLLTAMTAGLLLSGIAATAFSQTYGRTRSRSTARSTLQRPRVSPYINLLRNNGSDSTVGSNYYTLVRPQMESQKTNFEQGEAIRRNQQSITQLRTDVEKGPAKGAAVGAGAPARPSAPQGTPPAA